MEPLQQIYRRARYGRPVVVVSGLPRSGTSMAMKMLEAGGLELVTDHQRTADVDNPKGYFEDERVKDLAEAEDASWVTEARGRAIKVVSSLLPHLPRELNYRLLFMRRHLEEVVASQNKMLERRGETSETPDDRMMELYAGHLRRVDAMLRHAPHFRWIDLHYSSVLERPSEAAERVRNFLGMDLDVERMAGAVDEGLYRNRAEAAASAAAGGGA
ncbi:MAG: sulfotransferase family protein [Thermoanaerobaculia bacterium]